MRSVCRDAGAFPGAASPGHPRALGVRSFGGGSSAGAPSQVRRAGVSRPAAGGGDGAPSPGAHDLPGAGTEGQGAKVAAWRRPGHRASQCVVGDDRPSGGRRAATAGMGCPTSRTGGEATGHPPVHRDQQTPCWRRLGRRCGHDRHHPRHRRIRDRSVSRGYGDRGTSALILRRSEGYDWCSP